MHKYAVIKYANGSTCVFMETYAYTSFCDIIMDNNIESEQDFLCELLSYFIRLFNFLMWYRTHQIYFSFFSNCEEIKPSKAAPEKLCNLSHATVVFIKRYIYGFIGLIDVKISVFPYNRMKGSDSSGDGAFQKWNKLLKIYPTKNKLYFELDCEWNSE